MKTEQLWPCPREVEVSGQFDYPAEAMLIGLECPEHLRNDLETIGGLTISENPSAYKIELKIDSIAGKPERYILDINPGGTQITGTDKAGLFYGIRTFLQVLAMCAPTGKLTELNITDSPAYKKRTFMIDMGRSVFQMDMIKRVIRILARLKMNQLHMHLYDDELCGIKFDGLPFGTDNPYAISMKELGEIVKYAADYHVEIVPELEAWGHVSSIVYDKKHLRGGEGTCDGSSFLFCEETFELMTEMIRQVIEVMPQKGVIHLGLDEAKWFVADDMPKDYTPSDMMARFYQIVQDIAKKDGKEIMLRFWADHIHRGGRPVPQEIQHNSMIEPWQYWQGNNDRVDTAIEKYSGQGKMRWMMGAGQSTGQTRGAYHATRHWCKQAGDAGLPVLFDMDDNIHCYGVRDEVGLPRLEKALQYCPQTTFIGHGPSFWAEISADDQHNGYPEGAIKPDGGVVRLMDKYSNLWADLSAGSGYNTITRDKEFGLEFLDRFADKLLFGTDVCEPYGAAPIVDYLEQRHKDKKISEEKYSKIMCGNAVALLGL